MPSTEFEHASRLENWHQSTIDTLLSCGRRYWAEYVSGLPVPGKPAAVAGTAFHAAVQVHEEARLAGNPEGVSIEEMFAAAAACIAENAHSFTDEALAAITHTRPGTGRGKTATPGPTFTGLEALTAQAEDACTNWWNAPVVNPDDPEGEELTTAREWVLQLTPLAVELYAKASFAATERPLAGTIDAVYWDPRTQRVRLVDLKTAASLSDWKDPGKKATQATFYSALVVLAEDLAEVSEHLPAPELPEFTYVVVRRQLGKTKAFKGATTLTVRPGQLEVGHLAERVRAADTALAEGMFLPDPTAQWCKSFSCPIFDRCVLGDRSLAGSIRKLTPAA